jgi:mono/diheme cytochrome c family protein
MKRPLPVLSATAALLWSTFAHARAEEQRQGKEMLQKLCARCHSVGKTGSSPNKRAPPFRSFSETKLYDSDFKQRLETGLISIHPFMPTFRFSTEEAEEVLSYMRSIQERAKPAH